MSKEITKIKSEANTELRNQLKKLAEKWPSAFVAREKVAEFSGGILHPRRMANLDSLGLGPEGSLRVGRKRCYLIDPPLIDWMLERAQIIE